MGIFDPMGVGFLIGIVLGFIAGALAATAAFIDGEKQAEKRGVWTIKDRAYKLTKISCQ